MEFTIDLPPVTKKNSMRVVNTGRYTKVLPSKAYCDYERDAGYFLPCWAKINEPIEVTALFYMPTKRRVDLTNLLEALDDVLVKYGVIEDDNYEIIVSHDGSRVLYDREHPRTEVSIKFFSEK